MRRKFLRAMVTVGSTLAWPHVGARTSASTSATREIVLRRCTVFGFKYFHGKAIWPNLSIGAPLELIRDTNDIFDFHTFKVAFQGQALGHLPFGRNQVIDELHSRGEQVVVRITALDAHAAPDRRVGVDVVLVV